MYSYVSANRLVGQNHWSADFYCREAGSSRITASALIKLDPQVRCFEGTRFPPEQNIRLGDLQDGELIFYKPVNVQPMFFNSERRHFQAVPLPSKTQVEPDDVVVTKHAPVRAAIATKAVVRHPIDSNCLIIRGLQPKLAFWTAYCINQSPYSQRLLDAGTGVTAKLPRVSLRALREVAVPQPPGDLTQLAASFAVNCDELLASSRNFWDLQTEVELWIEESLSTVGEELHRIEQDTLTSGDWFAALDIQDSLVPLHVQLAHIQGLLRREVNWVTLSDLLIEEPGLRRRFEQLPSRGRYLGLRAGESELTINESALAESFNWAFRIFSQPLSDGEVLLSTLVTKPQVIFADWRPAPPIYVSDQWERLRFRETPGAWALVLNSMAVQRLQLSRMALGQVQQFTSAAALRQVWVPDVPIEQRRKWEQSLIRHHELRRERLEIRDRLLSQVHALFNEAHGLPPDYGEVLPRL